MVEWIVAIAASSVIIITALVGVVLILNNSKQPEADAKTWRVELWNLQRNYRVVLNFEKTIVLGRYTVMQNAVCDTPVEADSTISREHVLVYEQNKILWAWNLSKVNTAVLDAQELTVPRQLVLGAKLKLGDSIYLVTNISLA